jgi:putative solute:sodium symporter small subunit
MSNDKQTNLYWKKNILYLAVLLGVWFIVSYGFSIVFANSLNSVKIGGFKLGFWFAQQGSIYVYLVLIAVYVFLMNRLDKEFDVEEK